MVRRSQAEVEERVNIVLDQLAEGMREADIKRIGRERWGVSTHAISRYMNIARGWMAESTMRPREVWRAEQLLKYAGIANNLEFRTVDRLRAMERIDKLLGLEVHESMQMKKVELSGPNGGPITSQSTVVNVDLTSKLAEFATSIRSAALANALESVLGGSPPADTIPIEPHIQSVDERQQK